MLGLSSSFNGAVKKKSDNDAPEENRDTKGAEDGAHGNENGTAGGAGVLHERSVASRRNSWRRIGRNTGDPSQCRHASNGGFGGGRCHRANAR